MSDNVKTIKVDPTGFYLNKEDSKQSVQSEPSDVSSITDSSSEEDNSPSNSDLVHLPNAPVNVSVIKEGQTPPEPEQVSEPAQQPTNMSGGANNVKNVENYLPVKKPLDDDEESVNSQYSQKDIDSEELTESNDTPVKQNTQPNSTTNTQETTTSRNDYYSDDEEEIIDMTDNKLYEVLASVFEDEEGDNVSENLAKLNRNLERHNDLLEKILNEFVSMNNEKHKERKFFQTLALTVQNHSRLLKNKNLLEETEEVLDEALSTEVHPTDNEETDDKVGGKKVIKRMKNRISTPNIRKLA